MATNLQYVKVAPGHIRVEEIWLEIECYVGRFDFCPIDRTWVFTARDCRRMSELELTEILAKLKELNEHVGT